MLPKKSLNILNKKIVHYNVVLLGAAGVGKSKILQRCIKDTFTESSTSTIGAVYAVKSINLEEKIVKLNICDTAGNERYEHLLSMYYGNADAVLVVYDIQNRDSFTRAKHFVQQVRSHCKKRKLLLVLMGNKADMHRQRAVCVEEVNAFAWKQKLYFLDISAKSGKSIQTMFNGIAKRLQESRPVEEEAQNRICKNVYADLTYNCNII